MSGPHQKNIIPDATHSAAQLLAAPTGKITLAGFDNNIQAALRYLSEWLDGRGAAPIFNMMEDAATAEIARAQLWQWARYGAQLEDGRKINVSLFANRLQKAKNAIDGEGGFAKLAAAADILESLVAAAEMPEFLTLEAYSQI